MADDFTATMRERAASSLAALFTGLLAAGDCDFGSFEERAIAMGHDAMADAMGRALERLDAELCASLPEGCGVHDARARTLATEVGDVTFRYRRARDRYGNTAVPLADALDLPWHCRVSPGAESFLVEAGAEVSYLAAARLLARKGGSRVSATTVMNCLRRAGELCRAEDAKAAADLYELGILPDGDVAAAEICVEADGTWVPLQKAAEGDPDRIEVKALTSYDGKIEAGRRVKRSNVVRHAIVGRPDAFWTQGVARIGARFDLSKVSSCHLGTDGEGWCKGGGAYMPARIEVTGHLDPFHVNRAVLGCFPDPKMGWRVLEVLLDGDKDEAVALLEACRDAGFAREGRVDRVIGYLRNNMDLIGAEGPSLGTMESENQHLYKSRMASVPCAWSRTGASDMARLRSRSRSGMPIPRRTRAQSETRRHAIRRERRAIAALAPKGGVKVVESVGSGYLPPHQAKLAGFRADVRYSAALDCGMPRISG